MSGPADAGEIRRRLEADGWEVLSRKGGGVWVHREGETRSLTWAQARKLAGLAAAAPRVRRGRVGPYGDWATVAAMSRVRFVRKGEG